MDIRDSPAMVAIVAGFSPPHYQAALLQPPLFAMPLSPPEFPTGRMSSYGGASGKDGQGGSDLVAAESLMRDKALEEVMVTLCPFNGRGFLFVSTLSYRFSLMTLPSILRALQTSVFRHWVCGAERKVTCS